MTIKTRELKTKEQLRANPILFGRVCMPRMFSLPSPALHYEWSNLYLDKSIKKINIEAPRGMAKSSIWACVFVMHHIFADEPGTNKVVVLSSKTQGHTVNLLQTIKDVLDYSIRFRSIYGYHGRHVARTWTRDTAVLKTGDVITCRGIGQQIHGIKYGDQRPTLFVADDLEDENNTKTAEAMDQNLKWLLQAAVPCLDAEKGRIINIATPENEGCICETLFDMGDWHSKRYSAIIVGEDGDLRKGKSLWEEQFTVQQLLEEKAALEDVNRVSIWYKQRMCVVMGDEEQLFKEGYLRYYSGYLEGEKDEDKVLVLTRRGQEVFDPAIKIPVYTFMGVDPATRTTGRADYFAIVPIAIDADNNRYVLPYIRKRMPPSEALHEIVNQYKRWSPERVNIETTQAQETFRELLRNLEDIYIPGLHKGFNPRDKKSKRYLEVLEPWFYKRKVFLAENMDALKGELLMYPRGKHDDLLDGLYYAMRNAYAPAKRTVEKKTQAGQLRLVGYDWHIL